jgi:hypothetical protein
MLAEKGALRKRSGDGGPVVLHMRSMNDEDREQRYTMLLNTVNSRDIASHLPTEIVMCLQ